jgi:hypothetical protein
MSGLNGRAVLIDNLDVELDHASVVLSTKPCIRDGRSHVDRILGLHGSLKRPGDFEQGKGCSVEQSNPGQQSERHPDKHRPVGDALAEAARRRKDVVGMERIVVAGEPGKLHDVRFADRPSRAGIGLADGHVFEEDRHRHSRDVARSRFLRGLRSNTPGCVQGSVPGGKI